MMKRILIVAAHPDDEILGLGGTIRKLIQTGYEVTTVLMAKGRQEEDHHIRSLGISANQRLGIKEVIFLENNNLELEMLPLHVLNKQLEAIIQQLQPEMIFTHHDGDLNRDHQITFRAVMTAARPLPGRPPIEIICFETVSSSEWAPSYNNHFKPNYYVDITETFDDKIQALQHYDVEMREFPHPRSYEGLKHLAHVRGMTVGVVYAEAFEIVRRIWK